MQPNHHCVRPILLAAVIVLGLQAGAAWAAPPSPPDGSHGFDFLMGSWKAHLRRMIDPKTGLTTSDQQVGVWVEYDGILNDKKLLDTSANFEQFEVTSTDGKQRLKARRSRNRPLLQQPRCRRRRATQLNTRSASSILARRTISPMATRSWWR